MDRETRNLLYDLVIAPMTRRLAQKMNSVRKGKEKRFMGYCEKWDCWYLVDSGDWIVGWDNMDENAPQGRPETADLIVALF